MKTQNLKQELSFLYAKHRHDLFYITVKYHQNISDGLEIIELKQKCLRTDGRTMDGRQAHRYIPRTFRLGEKRMKKYLISENHIEIGKRSLGWRKL